MNVKCQCRVMSKVGVVTVLKCFQKLAINGGFSKVRKLLIMSFYAVARGRTTGIFMNWNDCEAQVKGFSGARYKKFNSIVAAQDFITNITSSGIANPPEARNVSINVGKTNNSSNNSLKRQFSTTYEDKPDPAVKPSKNKRKSKAKKESDNNVDETFSDDSEDLNEMLNKQMDDIEKRLKGFQKGVDKIICKQGVGRKTIFLEPPIQKRPRKQSKYEFSESSDGYVQVYTDGACSSNGKTGARAGLGVYWGEGHPLNVCAPVSGRATNNCGEIQAASQAIKIAVENGVKKLAINTDSKFLINSVTKWMPGWKRKGWKLKSGEPVKNEIDFKELDSLLGKIDIRWNYVEAHKGVHGNEMADQLAKAGAAMYNTS